MIDEWKQVKSHEVHKNPYYRVLQDDVIMPSGQMGKYTYVDRKPAVIIAAINKDQELYLVGQFRYPIQKATWEIPMGVIEKDNADMLKEAKRELLEEVGIEAKNWQEIGKIYFAPGICNQSAIVFVAQDLIEKEPNPSFTEFLSMKKIKLDKFEQMIAQGDITDGPSIAAFYKLKIFLAKK